MGISLMTYAKLNAPAGSAISANRQTLPSFFRNSAGELGIATECYKSMRDEVRSQRPIEEPTRVKLVVDSVMQPTVE
jgi:hypothetical protein